jgi:hypothetical protein
MVSHHRPACNVDISMLTSTSQYAEDQLDNAEETSDEEGPKRQSSRSPVTPRAQPVKSTRRISRQQQPPTEEAVPLTPRGVDASQVAHSDITADSPTRTRADVPRVSVKAGEEYYATSKPPSSAPPPPPRPDKVRPGEQQRQVQESGFSSNNPYVPAEPRVDSPGGWPNDYVQSAARRQQRNGVLGRA